MSSKSWRLYTLTNLSITKPIRCITSSSDFEKGQNLFLYVYIVFHEYGVLRILSTLKFSLHIKLTLDFGLCMILFPFNSRKITQNIDDIPPHFKHRTECVWVSNTNIYCITSGVKMHYLEWDIPWYICYCIYQNVDTFSQKSFFVYKKFRLTAQNASN